MSTQLRTGERLSLNNAEDILQQLVVMNRGHSILKRWMVALVSCFAATLVLLLLSFDTPKPKVVHAYENNILKVRGIGVERVWIGAPATDPLLFGRLLNRGEGFNGILMFDKTGTERSGYGTFDGSNVVGITPDESGRMVAGFIAQDAGAVKLTVLPAGKKLAAVPVMERY